MSQRKSMESSNNGNQQQNTRESIRQLMKKRKMSKTLPENFFENILELEIKLKRDFAITTLKELIYMYSVSSPNNKKLYKD